MPTDKIDDEGAQKIALEQYRNVIGYLQYENTTYWTRSGFMLIAHAALLGFLTRLLPDQPSAASWQSIGLTFGVSLFGLALSLLWMRAIQDAIWWINRWLTILLVLEPQAYGEINVFRDVPELGDPNAPPHRLRKVAEQVVWLFRAVWISGVLYAAALAAQKIL